MDIRTEPLKRLIVRAPEYDAEFELWGNCPVQALGTCLSRDLYFRARHSAWSFEIADHAGKMPFDGNSDSDGFFREGDYRNASYMSHQDAIVIMERCLREYAKVRESRDLEIDAP